MLSIEGHQSDTDLRRGEGVHAHVLTTMERLHRAGVFFGASLTVTLSDWGKTVKVTKPADVKSPSAKPSAAPKSGEQTRTPVG